MSKFVTIVGGIVLFIICYAIFMIGVGNPIGWVITGPLSIGVVLPLGIIAIQKIKNKIDKKNKK